MNTIPALLKLTASGLPVEWIGWEEAVCAYVQDKVLWEIGEEKYTVRGGISDLGIRSTIDISPIIAVNDQSKKWAQMMVPPLCKKTLFKRDKGLCMYCGKGVSRTEMEIEHIVPRSKGGPNKWENVVSSCPSCNDIKGARTPSQAGMKLLAVPYEPNTAEWLILSGRNIVADQMEYLMKFCPDRTS